jgi:hypothetical protein
MKQKFIASLENYREKFSVAQMYASGIVTGTHGICITVEPFELIRSLDQNSKLWPMLHDVSKQVDWVLNGKTCKLSPEQWKDVFTAALKRMNIAPGIDGGFVMLGNRTSKMPKKDFGELIDLIYAFGADKCVVWSEPPDVSQ